MKDLTKCTLLTHLGELDDRNYTLSDCLSGGNFEPFGVKYNLPIKDQGKSMMCVGYSHSEAVEIMKGLKEPLSQYFIYHNRDLSATGGDNPFQGYYNKMAEKHLLKEGVCLLKDYDNFEECPEGIFTLEKVKQSLLPKAEKYKIDSFLELKNVDELKAFMTSYTCPAIVSIAVYESVAKIGKDGIFPKSSGKLCGYHSVCAVRFNDKYIKILNSIGKEWGEDGYGYIPLDDDKVIQEMRGMIVDDNKSELVVNIPKKSELLYRVQISANRNKEYAIEDQNVLAKIELSKEQRNVLGIQQNYLGSCLIYEKELYKCQIGSFSIKENANILLKVLQELGYKDAWITEYRK